MKSESPTKSQFADIFLSTHRDVFRFAAWLTSGDLSWAEDITAETYERAWEKRTRLEGGSKDSRPWLFTIARNLFVDGYRSTQSFPTTSPDHLESLSSKQGSPESELVQREEAQMLWGLVSQLPVEQMEILVLRYVFDWKVKDIAAYVNKSPNSVSVATRRILSTLEGLWEKSEGLREAGP